MNKLAMGLSVVLTLAWVGEAAAGRLYRWVDEQGNVHFSDKLPPKASKRAREELNSQGAVVKKYSAQKTQEEIAAEEERQAELEAERRRKQERAENDRILLQSYGSVRDLEAARDSRISTLESYIRVSEHTIGNLQRQLAQQEKLAANSKRAGKPVPEAVQQDIAATQAQIATHEQRIAERRKEQEAIKERFNADIKRYRQLTRRR